MGGLTVTFLCVEVHRRLRFISLEQLHKQHQGMPSRVKKPRGGEHRQRGVTGGTTTPAPAPPTTPTSTAAATPTKAKAAPTVSSPPTPVTRVGSVGGEWDEI